MKVVFISPYIKNKHAGGGEKHLFDVALALPKSAQVTIAIPMEADLSRAEIAHRCEEYRSFYQIFLGKSLNQIDFIPTPLFTQAPWHKKLFWTSRFDHLYFVTDGSIFFSLARNNHLHVQIPFTSGLSKFQSLKLSQWHSINTNSEFTRKVVERTWGVSVSQVLYPAVSSDFFSVTQEKSKKIVSVGRFFSHLHSKRQDILVQAFRKLMQQQPTLMKGWELVLIGAVENKEFFQKVMKLANGLPVRFAQDLSHTELVSEYQSARIYWHGTGFGIDSTTQPEKTEHFGISVVEAMAAGAIPFVVPSGGQVEAIPTSVNELCWKTEEELVSKTIKVLKNPSLESSLRKDCGKAAHLFSEDVLKKEVRRLFYEK